jgi:hypothetical protein
MAVAYEGLYNSMKNMAFELWRRHCFLRECESLWGSVMTRQEEEGASVRSGLDGAAFRRHELDPDCDGVMIGTALIYAAAVILVALSVALTLEVWPATVALLVVGLGIAQRRPLQ